jgi:hypothetical protein
MGPKTDAHLKTVPKPENKNYDHFTPISGQGSARRVEVDKQYLTQKTNSRSAGCNFGGCAWSNMSTEARRQNLL